MAAPKTSAAKPSSNRSGDPVVLLGSTSIQPVGAHGSGAPAGVLHLVDGWDTLCGSGRVRFVFPGRAAVDGTCADCLQASLPRPRPARSRARAS